MKKKYIICIIIILIPIIFLLMAWVLGWKSLEDKSLKKEGEYMAIKIEEYRNQNGKLPEKISETGLPEPLENDPPWYTKLNDKDYVIYFPGSTLGESTTYYSNTKQWQDF